LELPEELITSLTGLAGFNPVSFRETHNEKNEPVSIRFNLKKKNKLDLSAVKGYLVPLKKYLADPVPWCNCGSYLKIRPSFTFDPHLHGGVYYVQEASSMFLEHALKNTIDLSKPLRVLDLCAAPGGKSTHIQSLISSDSLLVSNEVIRSRVSILEENLIKWGGLNTIISQNDPQAFRNLPQFFDLVLVDAPCSGSGLFRRDPEAIREWSFELVNHCCKRQQRILADVLPSLKSGGLLVYSTCSYSREENEDIIDWLVQECGLESLSFPVQGDWGIIEAQTPNGRALGYRFYPDKLKGEGLFLACLRKPTGEIRDPTPPRIKADKLNQQEKALLKKWVVNEYQIEFDKYGEVLIAMPENFNGWLSLLQKELYIKRAGVRLGKISGKELIPHHELAMNEICARDLPFVELTLEESITYLRRDDLKIASGLLGWTLVRFGGINLGWAKMLGSRINNYYPLNWRILKSQGTISG